MFCMEKEIAVKKMKLLLIALAILGIMSAGLHLGPFIVAKYAYAQERARQEATRAELAEMGGHDQLSVLFRTVAKVVRPAVVEVHVRTKVQAMPRFDLDDLFRRRFGQELPPNMRRRGPQPRREYFRPGLGSGVIVDAEGGYILTNAHVVEKADEVEVVLADRRKFKAEWVRTDPQTDLAVIKIKSDDLIDVPLGDSDEIFVGDWVLAIGSPRGLDQTVTAGIISAKGRTTGLRANAYENFLQTDAAINRGNSGGPLVNMRGEVIGINSQISSASGGSEGIGFAIPSNMVKRIMEQLIQKGKVTRGLLGVRLQGRVSEELARSFSLPSTKGALITGVARGTPAEAAGLKAGDFIVSVAGKAVESSNELRNRIAAVTPGTTVKIEVYREGEKQQFEVTIGEQPEDLLALFGEGAGSPESVGELGLKVASMSKELAAKYGYSKALSGVVIVEIDADSEAAKVGLKEGIVILQVRNKAVSTPTEFSEAVEAGKADGGVRLLVTDPRGAQLFTFIPMKK